MPSRLASLFLLLACIWLAGCGNVSVVVPRDPPPERPRSTRFDTPRRTAPDPPPPSPPCNGDEEECELYVIVDSMPELIGGLGSIHSQLEYPEEAARAGVEGRVFVQFVVDQNGRPVDPVVTRGIGAGCDEEAIRIIRLARFEPGSQKGEPVRVKMSLPITFKLR